MSVDLHQAASSRDDLVLLLAGDLILDIEKPEHWLSGIAPIVQAADVAIGHLEVPHTRRGSELAGDVPAPAAPPENLDAIADAGFAALSLAGNHIADWGKEGIEDTIERLDALGIAHCGAGATLDAARAPAVIRCRGRRIALLSYNCVGPEIAWASDTRAGCNYLRIETADGGAVKPSADLAAVTDEALSQLTEDIVAARGAADLLIVALHKGIVHTPAVVAPYERMLAVAAISAGADVVVGHHAHILRGIEISEGRPVFHGLGNGCVVTRALAPGQQHAARAAWVERRRQLFGFEPDPRYPLAPFHPEAVNGVLGIVISDKDGTLSTGIVPTFVEPPGRPIPATGECADRVVAYLEKIGHAAGLATPGWQRRSDAVWMCS